MKESKIEIRKLTNEDSKKYIELIENDDEVKKYIPYLDRTDEKSYNQLISEQNESGNEFNGIFLKDGTLVGIVSIESAYMPQNVVEASFFIGKDHRRKGYAKEALAKTIQSLEDEKTEKLYFQIAQDNESCKKFVVHNLDAKLENYYEENEMYSIPILSKRKRLIVEQVYTNAIRAFHDIDDKEKREQYVRDYTFEFCNEYEVDPRRAIKIAEEEIQKRRKSSMFKYPHYDKIEDIVYPDAKKESRNKKKQERFEEEK